MAISKIKTKSLALSSVNSDIILNSTVKFIDLDPEVVTFVQNTTTIVQNNSATNWNYQGTDLKSLSGSWQSTFSVVSSLSSSWDSSISNSYTHNNFLPLSGGTITENLSVSKNVIVSGIISASASNVRVNVINVSASRIFTDSDNNRVVHINTTTNPLSAIFPNSLSDGFNVAIMNTGTNNLILSATQLNSLGTIIAVRFGGVFVYKDSGNLFAVGRLS